MELNDLCLLVGSFLRCLLDDVCRLLLSEASNSWFALLLEQSLVSNKSDLDFLRVDHFHVLVLLPISASVDWLLLLVSEDILHDNSIVGALDPLMALLQILLII